MLHEKTSAIEEVLLFKPVKFSMSEAAVILLKEIRCLKHSKITLSNEKSVETPAISSMTPHARVRATLRKVTSSTKAIC